MNKSHALRALRTLFIVSICTSASASVIYSYSGNFFDSVSGPYSTSMKITGTVELASVIPRYISTIATPISFSFSDGINSISETNSSHSSFFLATDQSGAITNWNISIQSDIGDQQHLINTENLRFDIFNPLNIPVDAGITKTCDTISCDGNPGEIFSGGNSNAPGSWTLTAVPIPPAIYLFSYGLLGLIGISSRPIKGRMADGLPRSAVMVSRKRTSPA